MNTNKLTTTTIFIGIALWITSDFPRCNAQNLDAAYRAACGDGVSSAIATISPSTGLPVVNPASCVCNPDTYPDGIGRPCGRTYTPRFIASDMPQVCGVGTLRAYARCRGSASTGATCMGVHACECADVISSAAHGFEINATSDPLHYGDVHIMTASARVTHPHIDDADDLASWKNSGRTHPRLFRQCACAPDQTISITGVCARRLEGCDARSACGPFAASVTALCIVPGRCIPAWFGCTCTDIGVSPPSARTENGVVTPSLQCAGQRDSCTATEVNQFCPPTPDPANPGLLLGRFTTCSVSRSDGGARVDLIPGSCGGFQLRRRNCATDSERFRSCGSTRATCVWDAIANEPMPVSGRMCVCEPGRVWSTTTNTCEYMDRGYTECTTEDRLFCPTSVTSQFASPTRCRARTIFVHTNFTWASTALVTATRALSEIHSMQNQGASNALIDAISSAATTTIQDVRTSVTSRPLSALMMTSERSQSGNTRAMTLRVPECWCMGDRGTVSTGSSHTWVSKLDAFVEWHEQRRVATGATHDLTNVEVAARRHTCITASAAEQIHLNVLETINAWQYGRCPSTHGVACNGHGSCPSFTPEQVEAIAVDARTYAVDASLRAPGANLFTNVVFQTSPPHPYAPNQVSATNMIRSLVAFLYSRATGVGAVGARWVQLLPGFIEDGFPVPVEAQNEASPAFRTRPAQWHHSYLKADTTRVDPDEHVVMFQVDCSVAVELTTDGSEPDNEKRGYALRRLLWDNLIRRGVRLFESDQHLAGNSSVIPGTNRRVLERFMYGTDVIGGDITTDTSSTGDSCASRIRSTFGTRRAQGKTFESPCLEWGHSLTGASSTGFERTGGLQPNPSEVMPITKSDAQNRLIFDRYFTQCEHVTNVECQHELCVNSADTSIGSAIERSRRQRVTRNGITCNHGSTPKGSSNCPNWVAYDPFCSCAVTDSDMRISAPKVTYFNPLIGQVLPSEVLNDHEAWYKAMFDNIEDADAGRTRLAGESCKDKGIGDCFATLERGCNIASEYGIYDNMRHVEDFVPMCTNTERTLQGFRMWAGSNTCFNFMNALGWHDANTNNFAHENYQNENMHPQDSDVRKTVQVGMLCQNAYLEPVMKRLRNLPLADYKNVLQETILPGRGGAGFDRELFEAVVNTARSSLRGNWCARPGLPAYNYAIGVVWNALNAFPTNQQTDENRYRAEDELAAIYAGLMFDERLINGGMHRSQTHLPASCTDQELLDAASGSVCDRCPRATPQDSVHDTWRGVTAWWKRSANPNVGFLDPAQTPVYTVMDYVSADMALPSTVATRIDELYHRTQFHVAASAASTLDTRTVPLKTGRARSMHKVIKNPNAATHPGAVAETTHLLPTLIAVWNPRFSHVPSPDFQNARIARFHPYHLALSGLWMFPYKQSNVDADPILGYTIARDKTDLCAPAPSTGYTKPPNIASIWRELSAFGSRRGTVFDWSRTQSAVPRDDMTQNTAKTGMSAFRATGGDELPEMCIVTGKIGRYSMLPPDSGQLGNYASCACESPFGTLSAKGTTDTELRTPTHARADEENGVPQGCTLQNNKGLFPGVVPYCLMRRFNSAGTPIGWQTSDSASCLYRNSTNFCGNGYWEHTESLYDSNGDIIPSQGQCICARGWELESGPIDVALKRCVQSPNPCSHAQLGTCNGRGTVDPMTCKCVCTAPFFGETCESQRTCIGPRCCGSGRGTLNTIGACVCTRGVLGGWGGNDQCTAPVAYNATFINSCQDNGGVIGFTSACAAPPDVGPQVFDAAACSVSAFFTCTCPPHRFGHTCEYTMCPRDAQGRECGGPARGRCERDQNTGVASCVCTKSCETQLVAGEVTPSCRATMDAYANGQIATFPSWGGCACDLDLRSMCTANRTVNLCGSAEFGETMCRKQIKAQWTTTSSTLASVQHKCDCTRGESAGLSGEFCSETLCPVAGGRACNGRRCRNALLPNAVPGTINVECDCSPRIAGDRLLKGTACEIDATDACGSTPTIGSGLIRECSGRGTCTCNTTNPLAPTCGCVCQPATAGAKCGTSLCANDCVFGECVPGVGQAPAQCACRSAYTNAANGTCTANACAHGAHPDGDGLACLCTNPLMSYDRQCAFADCPRDTIVPEDVCGVLLPFDEPSGGLRGESSLKQCMTDGTCNCDGAYYTRRNSSLPCEWFCFGEGTASVGSGGACTCKRGWRGSRCNERVCHETARLLDNGQCACEPPTRMLPGTGECRVRTCANGLLLPSGACRCFPGFTGDVCDASVCGNNAPWDGINQRCVCELPITGTFCNQTDCGAQATFNPIARTCTCNPGWAGGGCTTRVCTGNYVPDVNFPSECICEPHFTGPDCTPPTCENGEALCFDGSCICLCENGFLNNPVTGQCTVQLCGNFGTWNPTTVCSCTPPFTFFANRIPRCQRSCFDFGTMQYEASTGTCICQPTHMGPECATLRPDPPLGGGSATGGGGGDPGGGDGGDVGVVDPILPPSNATGGASTTWSPLTIGLIVGGGVIVVAAIAVVGNFRQWRAKVLGYTSTPNTDVQGRS